MSFRLAPVALVAALLLSAAPALADYGGGDAPADWADAPLLAPGVHAGTLGGADDVDWFAVEHGATQVVEIALTLPMNVSLDVSLRDGAGLVRGHYFVRGMWEPGAAERTVEFAGIGDGTLLVGIDARYQASQFEYSVRVDVVERPDFTVGAIEVTSVPLETDLGPLATETLRDITVRVDNLGSGAGTGRVTLTVASKTDNRVTQIDQRSVTVDAAGSATFTVRWDATGVVGDVRIRAWADALYDLDYLNNGASVEHHVVVGGTGVGITIGNGNRFCAPGVLCASVSTSGVAWVSGITTPYGVASTRGNASAGHVSAVAGASLPATWIVGRAHYDVLGSGAASGCVEVLARATCTYVPLP